MRIYKLDPDSATQKTSITHAMLKGYRFQLTDEDGTATITNPEGAVYNVHNWQCDCQDSMFKDGGSYTLADTTRHACKHVLFLSQLYPCPKCKAGFMMLRMEAWKVYQCSTPGCYKMIPFQLIKNQRAQAYRMREQNAATPEKVLTIPEPPDAERAQVAAAASHAIFAH